MQLNQLSDWPDFSCFASSKTKYIQELGDKVKKIISL